MGNLQRDPVDAERPDPGVARTKDNPLGIDDIGLPDDMIPADASKLDRIRPDQEKLKEK